MKNRLKKLIQKRRLIDHMPFGSIEEIAKNLKKDRGTVRGVLQGKWVNTEIIEEAMSIIKADINDKQLFMDSFENEFNEINDRLKSMNK